MADERRRRHNLLDSTLGAALGSGVGDTTITFAAALADAIGNIDTLAADEHLALVIDDEVLWLTDYTAAATTGTVLRAQEGTTRAAHSNGATVRSGPTRADFPTTRTAVGPNGATRASTTYGPLSTAWTVTLPVISGQVVDLTAQVALSCSGNEVLYVAFRRGSTTVYENTHYASSPNSQAVAFVHFWRDEAPGSGDVVYEVYVASNGGATITLRNGATLDTTIELAQGKSILRATALMP